MMKRLLTFFIFMFFIAGIIAQEEFVNRDDYQKIEQGMTYREVVDILGQEGTIDSTIAYVWKDENLQVEWKDGRMSSFSTAGLPQQDSAVNGYAMVNEASKDPEKPFERKNLSYKDIVKLIGKPGEKSDKVRYLWPVSAYQKLRIEFRDGKVISKAMY
jgi:hypothetical protein